MSTNSGCRSLRLSVGWIIKAHDNSALCAELVSLLYEASSSGVSKRVGAWRSAYW